MGVAFDRIREALENGGLEIRDNHGDRFAAQCPAHDDINPSLSVSDVPDGVLLYCHAGCEVEDVLAELDLSKAALFNSRSGARYDFTDISGTQVLRSVFRTPDKKFTQRVKARDQVPLYHLPEVVQAVREGKVIVLCEGEKDANTAVQMGYTGTSAPMGASNFPKVDVRPLSGAKIIAIVDKDKAGEAWAQDVKERLEPITEKLQFYQASQGKDLSDHYASGHSMKELVPFKVPEGEKVGHRRELSLVDLRDFKMEVARFAKRDWYPLGDISIVSGAGGIGKSSITLSDVAAASRGELVGDLEGPQHCILLCHEDRGGTIRARLTAARADLDYVHLAQITETNEAGTFERIPDLLADLEALEAAIKETGASIVVIDPIQSYIEGNDHRRGDVRRVLDPLMVMAQRTGIALVGVAHTNKGGGKGEDKISGSHAWRDACRSHLFAAGDANTGEKSITLDKSNHTDKAGTSWAFETIGVDVEMSDGQISSIPVARITGETELSAEMIINRAPQTDTGDRNEVEQFLLDYLEEHGACTAKEVIKAGQDAGFDPKQIKNARQRAKNPKITSRKAGGAGTSWVWERQDHESLEFSALPQGKDDPETGKNSRTQLSHREHRDLEFLDKSIPTIPQDSNERSKDSHGGKSESPKRAYKDADKWEDCIKCGRTFESNKGYLGMCDKCCAEPKKDTPKAPIKIGEIAFTHIKYGEIYFTKVGLRPKDVTKYGQWQADGEPDLTKDAA